MKIHEYQGKEILRQFGVPTPRGTACFTVDEAVTAARELGGAVWVVKAQIHAGGRGKGGGVKVAHSLEEVRAAAQQILGMHLVTHQTGPEGQLVRRLLVEQGAQIVREFYLGMAVDRESQRVALLASSEGGMEIEEVAKVSPSMIHTLRIDPFAGLMVDEAAEVARRIGIPDASIAGAVQVLQGLYRAFVEKDAMLAEINPLVLTLDGSTLALDASTSAGSSSSRSR